MTVEAGRQERGWPSPVFGYRERPISTVGFTDDAYEIAPTTDWDPEVERYFPLAALSDPLVVEAVAEAMMAYHRVPPHIGDLPPDGHGESPVTMNRGIAEVAADRALQAARKAIETKEGR